MHVVVIGAGAIGVTSTIELIRAGNTVTLIDPGEPGGEQSASYGNAGWLNPSWVTPLSMPGLWRKIPKFLLDPCGPLTIDPRQIPRLAPWLSRFFASGATFERAAATSKALRPLFSDCDKLHVELARDADGAHLIDNTGQFIVYRKKSDFEAEIAAWRLRSDNGAAWVELDAHALQQREPGLDPRYGFGVHIKGHNCLSPGSYIDLLAQYARRLGASICRSKVVDFRFEGGRLTGVVAEGRVIECQKAIVCAGVHSKSLAAQLGDAVLLEAERGYHVMFEGLPSLPRNCALLADGRISSTPCGSSLRVTGHVEFSHVDAPPNWKRAEVLRDTAMQAYSRLWKLGERPITKFWMGARPSTPDSLPIIGCSSRSSDVVYAFGHGHTGLMSAPKTAQLVSDIVSGRPTRIDIGAYSARRFHS